jgi:hypothetical protein|tara:strand:- start:144 stop:323 length:180 start_codon:yes stop_codon:yes gene_type:complete
MNTKHKVTKPEVMDAIHYFHGIGMITNQHGDAEYYLKILLRKVANDYKMLLTHNEGEIL